MGRERGTPTPAVPRAPLRFPSSLTGWRFFPEWGGVRWGVAAGRPDLCRWCGVLSAPSLPFTPGHLMTEINNGMLHRAFSVFLFSPDGKLLLQKVRRGRGKVERLRAREGKGSRC